jgi:hypothetical protein
MMASTDKSHAQVISHSYSQTGGAGLGQAAPAMRHSRVAAVAPLLLLPDHNVTAALARLLHRLLRLLVNAALQPAS